MQIVQPISEEVLPVREISDRHEGEWLLIKILDSTLPMGDAPGQVLLSWEPGTGDPLLVRIGSDAPVTMRPSRSTSHVDVLPSQNAVICYLLASTGSSGSANSDVLCVLAALAQGFPPQNLTLQLNQSTTAVLTWGPAQGDTGYVLFPLGSQRIQLLPASANTATDQTGGQVTCYALLAQVGTSTSGISALLCGLPGFASGFATVAPDLAGMRASAAAPELVGAVRQIDPGAARG